MVVDRLHRQMKDAAAAERFEEAAVLRDQVLALKRVETPQKITTTETRERDLFAACVDEGRAALQVFSVRDGKVVAREGFLFESVADAERLLEATIQQFYAAGATCRGRCWCPRRRPGGACWRPWLAERRGGVVKIRVPQRGETLRLMDLVERNASLAYELEWKHPMRQSRELLRGLRDALALELEPRTIECFDISNIQGADIVASMVSFVEARPNKAGYRRFRVRTVSDGPDDFASMREVVGRRYARLLEKGGELPDLVLVDGGKGQLSAASDALAELGLGSQALASLAKKKEQIFLRGQIAPHRPAAIVSGVAARAENSRRGPSLRGHVSPQEAARSNAHVRARLDPRLSARLAGAACWLASGRSGRRSASEVELATSVGPRTARRIRAHFDGA